MAISKGHIVIYILAPLLSGVGIYMAWRGIPYIDPNKKYFPLCNKAAIPSWVVYSAPDGLYAFALFNTHLLIWKEEKWMGVICVLCLCSILILTEFLQRSHILPGTFDPADILAYICAAIFSLTLSGNLIHSHKIKQT